MYCVCVGGGVVGAGDRYLGLCLWGCGVCHGEGGGVVWVCVYGVVGLWRYEANRGMA